MIFLSRMIDGAAAGNISLAPAYISDDYDAHQPARFAPFLAEP
jgi:hypothetical protein